MEDSQAFLNQNYQLVNQSFMLKHYFYYCNNKILI